VPVDQVGTVLEAILESQGLVMVRKGPVAAITRLNIFSPQRTAPQSRYTPPGLARPTQPTAARVTTSPIQLFGIAVGPEGAVALIDADPDIPGAEIYRVGDTVRGALIQAITDSTVVLQGAGGQSVLRLPN
jgi:hypothetical protein